jgi:hypothetical protein
MKFEGCPKKFATLSILLCLWKVTGQEDINVEIRKKKI